MVPSGGLLELLDCGYASLEPQEGVSEHTGPGFDESDRSGGFWGASDEVPVGMLTCCCWAVDMWSWGLELMFLSEFHKVLKAAAESERWGVLGAE
jgi:hypothetical protein